MSLAIYQSGLLRDDRVATVAAARAVFRAARLGKVNVQLTFVIDAEMRALNRRWRKKDRPTDVLSFSAWDGEAFVGGDDAFMGDLVISVETAARQSRECGHPLSAEVAVLVAHGLCHLAGLDHERGLFEAERQLMVEMCILDSAGLDPQSALSGRG